MEATQMKSFRKAFGVFALAAGLAVTGASALAPKATALLPVEHDEHDSRTAVIYEHDSHTAVIVEHDSRTAVIVEHDHNTV
jgi:hypothetical protein